MNRALRSFLFAIVFAVAGWALANTKGAPPSAPDRTITLPSIAQEQRAPAARAAESGIGFRNAARLAEHYAKHGREFGDITEAEYLRLAQQLRDAPVSANVLELVRPSDGVISRFDRASGAFLAVDRDRTIRTFFKPNDGEAYFRRQSRRSPRS